jgi:hypothetical protein
MKLFKKEKKKKKRSWTHGVDRPPLEGWQPTLGHEGWLDHFIYF